MNRFKSLTVWQKSIELASLVYQITYKLPESEKFGLISQLRRNAVSIPSNIAEGAGRNSNREFCYFLSIAQGSTFEMETQFMICLKLKYLLDSDLDLIMQLIHEIQNMLFTLQNKLINQN